MVDPDEQIQYFNLILLWLLDLHALLRSYVVNPWKDVAKATIERDIAYRVSKRRRTAADRIRCKEQRRRVNYLVRKAK
jgi:hypothetical protein